jgi:hypothetical protein
MASTAVTRRRSLLRQCSLALAVTMALAACREDEVVQPAPRGAVDVPAPPRTATTPQDLYGSDGLLRESDEVVAGLRLPVGLTKVHGEERRHVYRTRVPLRAVQRYFGPRLVTGQVDEVGTGAVYRNAVPRGVRGGTVKLDVSILPVSSGTRVEIVEIRPPPPNPPDLAEIRRWAREKHWE